jgi:hypothetical protein
MQYDSSISDALQGLGHTLVNAGTGGDTAQGSTRKDGKRVSLTSLRQRRASSQDMLAVKTYSYLELKGDQLIDGVDSHNKELHIHDNEFEELFKMNRVRALCKAPALQ